jgi:HEAT repeat protein
MAPPIKLLIRICWPVIIPTFIPQMFSRMPTAVCSSSIRVAGTRSAAPLHSSQNPTYWERFTVFAAAAALPLLTRSACSSHGPKTCPPPNSHHGSLTRACLRSCCATAALRLLKSAALEPLTDILKSSTDAAVRRRALWTLAGIDLPQAASLAATAVTDGQPNRSPVRSPCRQPVSTSAGT